MALMIIKLSISVCEHGVCDSVVNGIKMKNEMWPKLRHSDPEQGLGGRV